MSTPFGLEHHRDHPVVDGDGNPVAESDPTLLPRDPDGTEADPSAEAEYRAGGQPEGQIQPEGQLHPEGRTVAAEPIVLPAGPDDQETPSHRKDTPVDADSRVIIEDDAGLIATGSRPDAGGDVPPPPAPLPEEVQRTAPPQAGDANWLELQGMFVDDPQAAVRQAAELLERAVADLRRQLESTDSTEDLRHAFRRYRDVYRSLR